MDRKVASDRPVERPIAGFVLSLVGGLFIVAGAIWGLLTVASYYGTYYYPYPGSFLVFVVLGLASGIGVLVGSALVYLVPRHRVAWGVVILVLGVAGFFDIASGSYGGFFVIGMVLSLVGGSLAIAWKPPAALEFADYRTCLSCGRHVLVEYPVCPFCGAPAPTLPASPRPPPTP